MTAVDLDALDAARARLIERLLERSEVDPETGCRRWTGTHYPKGYGSIKVNSKNRGVHIVAHELWIGPVLEGYEVDHVAARGCRYRDCFEPSHLEAVTHIENVRRATAHRTHCAKGHEYLPETTSIKWGRHGVPNRRCLLCHRRGSLVYNRRVRAEAKVRRSEAA